LGGVRHMPKATRKAPAQAELRPTCAGDPASTYVTQRSWMLGFLASLIVPLGLLLLLLDLIFDFFLLGFHLIGRVIGMRRILFCLSCFPVLEVFPAFNFRGVGRSVRSRALKVPTVLAADEPPGGGPQDESTKPTKTVNGAKRTVLTTLRPWPPWSFRLTRRDRSLTESPGLEPGPYWAGAERPDKQPKP
jgi:hypothetical protein